jgi:hypothetical protein
VRHKNWDTVLGEIAIPGIRGRHGCRLRFAGAISQSFEAAKEKKPVLDDFSSSGGAKLVPMKWRFGCAGKAVDVIEKVFCVQGLIAKEFVSRTMK